MKVPWCLTNQCAIPRHTAKVCEDKQCKRLVYMCESDAEELERNISAD